MTIQKCDRAEDHGAHATSPTVIDNPTICPGVPATKVEHLEERWRNGVGLDEYLPRNVCHLVAPIVGMLKMDLHDGKYPNQQILYYFLRRLETVLLLTRDQIVKDNRE